MDIIFKAELRNIKIVYNFLKSISFREVMLKQIFICSSVEGTKLFGTRLEVYNKIIKIQNPASPI